MVQLKYWGDGYDCFKYDLITSIVKNELFKEYVFIPMLTVNRENNKEGEKSPTGNKLPELLSFIQKHKADKSLTHWETWLKPFVNYHTAQPVDGIYFENETRAKYWDKYRRWASLKSALVFIDPDTGIQQRKPKSEGIEKYILNDELTNLISQLEPNSTLMVYQHLSPYKSRHAQGLHNKLSQIKDNNQNAYICGYREDNLAFVFVSIRALTHRKIFRLLNAYHATSTHPYKSEPIELLP